MAADGLLFFRGSAHSDQLLLPWESVLPWGVPPPMGKLSHFPCHSPTVFPLLPPLFLPTIQFPLSLSSSNFPLLSSHHHHLPSHFPPSHRPCYDVILVITFRVLFKDYFKLIQSTILEVRDICWTGKIFNHIDNYVSVPFPTPTSHYFPLRPLPTTSHYVLLRPLPTPHSPLS